mgnify:CR=1 FL=1
MWRISRKYYNVAPPKVIRGKDVLQSISGDGDNEAYGKYEHDDKYFSTR